MIEIDKSLVRFIKKKLIKPVGVEAGEAGPLYKLQEDKMIISLKKKIHF